MTRICPACGLPLDPFAHAAKVYHDNPDCQRVRRKNPNPQRKVPKALTGRQTCPICKETYEVKPGTRVARSSCYRPECIQARRVAKGLEAAKRKREQFILTKCLGWCGGSFMAPRGADGKALFHKCLKCRAHERKDTSFGGSELWGKPI